MRVIKEGARQGHYVRLAFGDDSFGLLCGRDHADRAHHDAGFAAQPLGNRRVVTRAARRPDLSRRTARRDVDVIEPDLLERFAEVTASPGVRPPSAQSLPVMRAPSRC
jgi:hypothetical protein